MKALFDYSWQIYVTLLSLLRFISSDVIFLLPFFYFLAMKSYRILKTIVKKKHIKVKIRDIFKVFKRFP